MNTQSNFNPNFQNYFEKQKAIDKEKTNDKNNAMCDKKLKKKIYRDQESSKTRKFGVCAVLAKALI